MKTKNYWILITAAVLLLIGLILHFTQQSMFSSGDYVCNYFAAGKFALGVFAAGNFSIGIFSVGIFSIGIFSLSIFNIAIYGIGFFIIAWKKRLPRFSPNNSQI